LSVDAIDMSGKHEVDLHTNIWKVPSDVKSLLLLVYTTISYHIHVCSNMTVVALIIYISVACDGEKLRKCAYLPSMMHAYMLAFCPVVFLYY
jgi:hypothetical protein